MVTRRRLLLSLGAGLVAAPLMSAAQPRQSIPRIGVLGVGRQADALAAHRAFTLALAELGYVEGRNLAYELRYADGDAVRLPALAEELAERKVDLIFAPDAPAVRAAQAATGTTPIVFALVHDPVAHGFVASRAQPGGNITGVSSRVPGLTTRRLQLLKQTAPGLAHIAFAIAREPGAGGVVGAEISDVQTAANTLGFNMLPIEIRSRRSFDDAGEVLARFGADGMSCLDSALNRLNRNVLIEFAARMKLPAVFPGSEYVAAGGLMSYGVSADENHRQAAAYVDKILRGAKPGMLPVESPRKVELAVNLITAGVLGVQFAPSVLEKADRVIG